MNHDVDLNTKLFIFVWKQAWKEIEEEQKKKDQYIDSEDFQITEKEEAMITGIAEFIENGIKNHGTVYLPNVAEEVKLFVGRAVDAYIKFREQVGDAALSSIKEVLAPPKNKK